MKLALDDPRGCVRLAMEGGKTEGTGTDEGDLLLKKLVGVTFIASNSAIASSEVGRL